MQTDCHLLARSWAEADFENKHSTQFRDLDEYNKINLYFCTQKHQPAGRQSICLLLSSGAPAIRTVKAPDNFPVMSIAYCSHEQLPCWILFGVSCCLSQGVRTVTSPHAIITWVRWVKIVISHLGLCTLLTNVLAVPHIWSIPDIRSVGLLSALG